MGRHGRGRGGMQLPSGFGVSRYEGSSGSGRLGGTPKGKGKCLYCHREGHWKQDCLKKQNDEGQETSQHSQNSSATLAFTVVDHASNRWNQGRWILDLGASQHHCSTKGYYLPETYREISQKAIEIADGSKIAAVGIGEMSIGHLHLSGVLYVPQVGGNLISIARLIDSGYEVSFGMEACTISNKGIRLIAKHEGNLYYLDE